MRLRCAVSVPASVVTAAVLLVLVPAATAVTHTGSGTYNYPPETTATGEDVEAYDTTKVNLLTSGSIGDDLYAYDDSTVTVSSGSIGGNLDARSNSEVNVSGGSMNNLYARDNSTLTVSGGSIVIDLKADQNSTLTVSGGTIGGDLEAYGDSTLTIIGSGFNFAYGDYVDDGPLDNQTLTGLLGDGTPINNQVFIDESATITLAVPEPATAALVLLGTGVLMCRPYSRAFGNEKAVRPAPRTIR